MSRIFCVPRAGRVAVPSSKSQLHRLLILAALGKTPVTVFFKGYSADVAATVDCLNALGAEVTGGESCLTVMPLCRTGRCGKGGERLLPCGESGTTLRFLLPVAGALGISAAFEMQKRLAARPMAPLLQQLCGHGMQIEAQGERLHCSGQLLPGDFTLPGDVSSQFISGLLLATAVLGGQTGQTSRIRVTGGLQSAGYLQMTVSALQQAGCPVWQTGQPDGADDPVLWVGAAAPQLPARVFAQGDDSAAAAFLCMGAFSHGGITVTGLSAASQQADRAAADILRRMGAVVRQGGDTVTVSAPAAGELRALTVPCGDVPDLVPVLAATAFFAAGETVFTHVERLRWKECDRLAAIQSLAGALGVGTTLQRTAQQGQWNLTVQGCGGGRWPEGQTGTQPAAALRVVPVDTFHDHRMAMAAAVAACGAARLGFCALQPEDTACVRKSYPDFWQDFAQLQPER